MTHWFKRHSAGLAICLAALGLASAYLRAYSIRGASEVPTVLVGDTIIVYNTAYVLKAPYSNLKLFQTGAQRRGDFVYLRIPGNPYLKSGFFKRVIGLPGETIELRENRVWIDGHAMPAKALDASEFAWAPKMHPIGSAVELEDGHWITFTPGRGQYRNHPSIRLSANQYFLLGDNRDGSYDSRAFGRCRARSSWAK